jgi:hypothetical protein
MVLGVSGGPDIDHYRPADPGRAREAVAGSTTATTTIAANAIALFLPRMSTVRLTPPDSSGPVDLRSCMALLAGASREGEQRTPFRADEARFRTRGSSSPSNRDCRGQASTLRRVSQAAWRRPPLGDPRMARRSGGPGFPLVAGPRAVAVDSPGGRRPTARLPGARTGPWKPWGYESRQQSGQRTPPSRAALR